MPKLKEQHKALPPVSPTGDNVLLAEGAALLGVNYANLYHYLANDPDAPKPVGRDGARLVYDLRSLEHFTTNRVSHPRGRRVSPERRAEINKAKDGRASRRAAQARKAATKIRQDAKKMTAARSLLRVICRAVNEHMPPKLVRDFPVPVLKQVETGRRVCVVHLTCGHTFQRISFQMQTHADCKDCAAEYEARRQSLIVQAAAEHGITLQPVR